MELLKIQGVSKSFPGVQALDNVDLSLRSGEIHALLGENGAGKSTLIKIITGVHQPDAGRMLLNGEPVRFNSPRDAFAAGISVVHQERNLIPGFSVAENICLPRLPRRKGLIDYHRIRQEARRWMEPLGLDLPLDSPASTLNTAQAQLVEIARALALNSKILLLDEPTASLTDQEARLLFEHLHRLRRQGISILLVSHKLEEVLAVSDRITVLRDGRSVAQDQPAAGMTRERLIQLMVGREVLLPQLGAKTVPRGEPALELRNVSTSYGHANVSFQLRHHEILGLYGPVGAGRSELLKAVLGVGKVTEGEVLVRGKPVQIANPHIALKNYGIGYVSEDRKGEGLILTHTLLKNIGITTWDRMARWNVFLNAQAEYALADQYVEKLAIATPSVDALVQNLSGGNQQKVSVAKWLAAEIDILIIDEPTVGIDVKARTYLHELIWQLACDGKAILLISSDMAEMIGLADRIIVMSNFQIVGEVSNSRLYDQMSEQIMNLIIASQSRAAG